jgi:hypothetical protein
MASAAISMKPSCAFVRVSSKWLFDASSDAVGAGQADSKSNQCKRFRGGRREADEQNAAVVYSGGDVPAPFL